MKPFVSNHSLFHPSERMFELLETTHLGFLSHCISGLSLKYLRSGFAVYVFVPPTEEFERAARLFDEGFRDIGPERLRRTPISRKVILPPGMLGENEAHLILQKPDAPADLVLSTDSLFYDPLEKKWTGNAQALADYDRGILRLLYPVAPNLADAVRVCSLSSMLDFAPCDETIEAIRSGANPQKELALPRNFLRSQLQKIVTGAKPSQGFLALENCNLLEWFMPELAQGRGLMQNRHHRFDIFHHCIYSCDAVERNDLHLRLAGLLHDIGKVPTRHQTASGEATFHNHEVVGAKIAGQALHRFGFSREVCEKVKFLVRNHMFHYTNEWTDRAVRRFLSRVSLQELTDLIDLRMADRRGSGKTTALPPQVRKMLYHIEKIKIEESRLKVRDLAVGGEDLKALGILPGPEYGSILKELLDRVQSGGLPNEREALLPALEEAVQQMKASQSDPATPA